MLAAFDEVLSKPMRMDALPSFHEIYSTTSSA